MDPEIRQENKDDYAAVFELNKSAFGRENEAKLVDLLRRSDAFVPELSLVAVQDDAVVGHILFTRIKIINSEGQAFDSLALAPMAVKPDRQQKGIGGKLIRAGLDKAREAKFSSVIVLGHEKYYPKFGFVPTTKWQIKAPFEVPEAAFMGIELVPGGLQGVSGTVKYPKEFEMV